MRQIVCVCSMRTLVLCMQWCNGNIESTASAYQPWTVVIMRLHVTDDGAFWYARLLRHPDTYHTYAQDDRYLWDFAVH